MKQMRFALMASMVWVGLLLFAACGKGGNQETRESQGSVQKVTPASTEKTPIKIGVILPLTGDAADYGKALQKGCEFAAEEVNASGGVKGSRISLIIEDSKAKPVDAISAYRKLTTIDKVTMVIGDMFSATTLAIAPLAQKDGVVLLSPTASAPEIPATGDHVFTIYPSSTDDGVFLSRFAADKLKPKTVIVLYVQADAMISCKKAFVEGLKTFGAVVSMESAFPPNTEDFRTLISQMREKKPDLVFIAAYLPEVSRLLVQSKELGFSSRFMTISTAYDQKIFESAGSAAEGLLLSAPFYDEKAESGPVATFAAAFAKTNGGKPNIWAGYGYDVIKIAARAIGSANGDKTTLHTALASVSGIPSVTGFTGFKPDRTVSAALRILVAKSRDFAPYQQVP